MLHKDNAICAGVSSRQRGHLYKTHPRLTLRRSSPQGAMLLMNAVCNKRTRPIDGSCCQGPRPPSLLQKLAACVFLGCALVLLGLHAMGYGRHRHRPVPPDVESLEERKPTTAPGPPGLTAPLQALCRMGVIMAYFYLCDRADTFMKEQKFYTHATFFVPLVYVVVLGLFFNESTKEVREMQTAADFHFRVSADSVT